jgi:phosphopentomutase
MPRGLLLVLDSVGIGAAPDADLYGDQGADTFGHIAEACAEGRADRINFRKGALRVPWLDRLGLGRAHELATGSIPPGLGDEPIIGRYGCAYETSRGKDTPSGHWELTGVPVTFDWGYFPRIQPCFPDDLVRGLITRGGLSGILGNCHASGTEIIRDLGEEHIRSGKPICYTSADSVFQIAAHEETFGLDRLYELCEIARALLDDSYRIGRVIARPFTGANPDDFIRTGNRHDYSVRPPAPTLLDRASDDARDVVSVGKIADIFAHSGTGRVFKAHGNDEIFKRTIEAAQSLSDGGLLVSNLIDFDSVYGHRRDVPGYAAALERLDTSLPRLFDVMRRDDLLVITADHGCDPTWQGTDHTREQVPVLCYSHAINPGCFGRSPYGCVADLLSQHLQLGGAPAQRLPAAPNQ